MEKIQTELMPASKELCAEIYEIKMNGTEARIIFKNGSFIKVVTASDSSRGNRANVLLLDEFRILKKDVVDKNLSTLNPLNCWEPFRAQLATAQS